jgi:hypothetical protein
MENRMDNREMKTNGSSVWPYVIAGSAIGGAVGYLFMTESGKKIRHSITHPDELANNLDGARGFMEQKTRMVTDRVHGIIARAKRGIDDGQRAYQEAGQEFRSRASRIETKNNEIASGVHNTVDKMSRTAVTVEQSVLDPICEIGALYRGIERGVRSLLGKNKEDRGLRAVEPGTMGGNIGNTMDDGPIPIQRDRIDRIVG